jgi:hypothetical protein
MKDEKAGAAMRDKESKQAGVDGKRAPRGGDPPPTGGGWEWTLNWDPIVFDNNNVTIENPTKEKLDDAKLIIGSCPRSPADVDRLIDEAGVEAIICLQCTLCHGAMKINGRLNAACSSVRPWAFPNPDTLFTAPGRVHYSR